MVNENDKFGDNPQDKLSELLRNFYKPQQDFNIEKLWENISGNIDSLFHSDMFSEKMLKSDGTRYSDEEKYFMGIEEYINNDVSSIKHKIMSDHLLSCKECRQNYNKILDKKKEVVSV